MGDIMSESMGGIISECPGDFIGIGMRISSATMAPHGAQPMPVM
jgi:hypothetical protein